MIRTNHPILLHACCGVCAIYVSRLLKETFKEVILYFYNPNIYPLREYEKRFEAVKKVSKINQLRLISEKYKPEIWFRYIKGLEDEPEGGFRCQHCFKLRLEKTAQYAQKKNIEFFTTTLSVSPYKQADVINRIGQELSLKYNLKFFSANFKKNDGFKKTMELAKRYDLYRQKYCGCIFSLYPKSK